MMFRDGLVRLLRPGDMTEDSQVRTTERSLGVSAVLTRIKNSIMNISVWERQGGMWKLQNWETKFCIYPKNSITDISVTRKRLS